MGEKFSFLHETIKDKPLEKKAVIKNLAIAIGLGLMFGVVAAISFAISNYGIDYFVSKSKVKEVVIEKEADNAEGEAISATEAVRPDNEEEVLARYEEMYGFMYGVSKEAEKSILPVFAVESDTDWFSERYESSVQGTGLVIADNRRELLILVSQELVNEAEIIKVLLPDGKMAEAKSIQGDSQLGLCIIGVKLENISDIAMSKIKMAKLGTSRGGLTIGKGVIAVGAPMGELGTMGYGMITSMSSMLQMPDTNVHILSTDIYGSLNGSGVLVNLKGEVVGVITHEDARDGSENLITAYGISDIKDSIERMCNNQDRPYLGVYVTDIDKATRESMKIPEGVYVTEAAADSPAMNNGIQSGDIIVMIGASEVKNLSEFNSALNKLQPGKEAVITVQRYVKGSYKEISIDVNISTSGN